MKRSKSHLSCICLAAALFLLAAGPGVGGELQVQQVAPDRRAADCTGEDCGVDVDIPCVPRVEADLPDSCAKTDAESDRRTVHDPLIPRVDDPQDNSGIPLIPGVTINQ